MLSSFLICSPYVYSVLVSSFISCDYEIWMSWKRVQISCGDDETIERQWIQRWLIRWRWQDIQNRFNALRSKLRRLRSRLRAGIVLSSKVTLQPLAWSTFLTKCYSLQMIIWLSCNLHGGNTSRRGALVPSGWRAVSCSGTLNPLCHNGFR